MWIKKVREKQRPAFLGSALFDTKAGILAAGHGALKAGTVLGKVTTTGNLAPVARTTVNAVSKAGQKVVCVADASKFEVGDEIILTQAECRTNRDYWVTITAVDSESQQNTITTTYKLCYSFSPGDLVRMADGSETAVGILLHDIDNGYKNAEIVIAGNVVASRCIGLDAQGRNDLRTAEIGIIYFPDRV